MKTLRTISGILGILALFAIIYEMLISPGYLSPKFAIMSAVALLVASILVLMGGRIKSLLAGIFFLAGGFLHMSHIGLVEASERAAGVAQLPDYIPTIIEMAGLAIPVIAGILALVSMIERSPSRVNA